MSGVLCRDLVARAREQPPAGDVERLEAIARELQEIAVRLRARRLLGPDAPRPDVLPGQLDLLATPHP